MTITLGMPHMDAGGLSENWLFRFCGDQHWQALCRSLNTVSSALVDNDGARLYPTFVAIRARYSQPLSAAGENESFSAQTELGHFGRPFFHSGVTFRSAARSYHLEMLTSFVRREGEGRNALLKTTPADRFVYTGKSLTVSPEILGLGRAIRRGEVDAHVLDGHTFPLGRGETVHDAAYTPSPYVDYNGAGLLYFAAYPTIADGCERRMIMEQKLLPLERDWALNASTLARDVFYYRNLDLGESLKAQLRHLELSHDRVRLWTRLVDAKGEALADILTVKAVGAGSPAKAASA